jgi:sigma-B regulation protein RsbU (phosphoserine phosphatase)
MVHCLPEWLRMTTTTARILIADDQSDVLEALQILVKNEGFSTEVVNSPRAVLDAVRAKAFDVLLLDLNYARDTTSGAEGLELLSRIQEIDGTLPVVLMTAWGSVELAVEAMKAGGCDFVQKPWDNQRLLHLLKQHVAEGQILREQKHYEKGSLRLIQEVEEAREIQKRLLPSEMPAVQGCDIQAIWQPANHVGGDYFDAIRLNANSVAFCIADVVGKGLPAALLMSNIQATVRAFARIATGPADICGQLNRIVVDNVSAGKFITFFYGVIDVKSGRLWYTNAGHLPPILIGANGLTEQLTDGGTVLGVIPDLTYAETERPIGPGDRLVLFTDGITEASNVDDEQFGFDRLLNVVLNNSRLPSSQILEEILRSVSDFTGRGLQDDATLMIVSM